MPDREPTTFSELLNAACHFDYDQDDQDCDQFLSINYPLRDAQGRFAAASDSAAIQAATDETIVPCADEPADEPTINGNYPFDSSALKTIL